MLATIPSATLAGVRGQPVTVEVHVGDGLPSFTVVGLPDEACRESRDRVRAALLSTGATWVQKRITVNLAPSSMRKGSGAGLDLPIAVGLLVATGQVPAESVEGLAFLGELGLDGSVRRVPGTVPLAAACRSCRVVVPHGSEHEAAVVADDVRGVGHLGALIEVLRDGAPWPPDRSAPPAVDGPPQPDLADVRGQASARLALEVAAAGCHHTLFIGPPGAGKTLLASRLPGLLPPLDGADALEATMIRSAAGLELPPGGLVCRPPFRAPHHGASQVALIGGGTASMRPGEISLAHGGVLFLDELGEFQAAVLDGLRQPLEEGVVRVVRARAAAEYPARFLLVAAMNPCPCGVGGPQGVCSCTDAARARYHRRVSGPLLDRFDLRLELTRPSVSELLDTAPGESSAAVAARVRAARTRALGRAGAPNGHVPGARLDDVMPVGTAAAGLLRTELERGHLSGRGLHRVRRVARTLADLDGAGDVLDADHVALALAMRQRFAHLDRRVA